MTPAARVATAIEILADILAAVDSDGASADVILKAAFRARRYAGSKDRAAITDLVYGVLRRRASLTWALGNVPATVRALMLAALASDGADVAALFAGGGYGASPLSDEEQALLQRLRAYSAAPPLCTQLEIPPWLLPQLERRFGDRLQEEMAALNERAPLDIRVNIKRITIKDAQARLLAEGIEAAPLNRSPLGLRAASGAKVTATALYRDGLIDIQDEAAQIASLMATPEQGGLVVDLCAGAGGKSLTMAAACEAPLIIEAFDIDASRLDDLKARAARAQAHNITATLLPEYGEGRAALLAPFAGKADVVVVDAPCSGTGTWRRNPELRWRLTPERLTALTGLQARLIREGAGLVKPSGRLIYMTCSLLRQEDEDIVNDFLQENPSFARCVYRSMSKRLKVMPDTRAADDHDLLLTPAQHACDGFYLSALTALIAPMS
ncbi:MAG: RsmB/NOP family class I SAM-dependent RNA methyltransferase [Sphingomonadales bacterium]|nr:RsmB/NOP family class I SAM-dependent RNA methyltransferase [Sphingomonadales bacterium]